MLIMCACLRTSSLFLCCLLAILLLQSSPTSSEYPGPDDFGFDEGSPNGPSNWGNMNPAWALCRDGTRQSPIDIDDVQLNPSLGRVKVFYDRSLAIGKNRGYDTQVRWPRSDGRIAFNGKSFKLLSLHWHFPSEHTFNGTRFPLEMHMVHQSSDNQTAVVGTVFQIGPPDPFLSPRLMRQLSRLAGTGDEAYLGILKQPWIAPSSAYYTYSGSLTTPPCTEGVTWILLQRIRTASKKQINLIRSLIPWDTNARPIQPLNGRVVSYWSCDTLELKDEA